MKQEQWSERVGTMFSPTPRIGPSSKGTFWVERQDYLQDFSDLIAQPYTHVCLDGPTGSGKTSLALTCLRLAKVRHSVVEVTASMSWADLCRQILDPHHSEESSIDAEIAFGARGIIPEFMFKLGAGDRRKALDSEKLRNERISTATEHDMAKHLVRSKSVLVLDDAERATRVLLKRVADLCKVLTGTNSHPRARVLLIGSGDIYRTVAQDHPALEDRLVRFSLGGFRTPEDSVSLIASGLNELGLRHPLQHEANQPEDRATCEMHIWRAANGLLKRLNRLGYEIARAMFGRKVVEPADILKATNVMIEKQWRELAGEYGNIIQYVISSRVAENVLRTLCEQGTSLSHSVPEIINRVRASTPDVTLGAVEQSLKAFVMQGVLIRTGKVSETIFFRRPSLAHMMGVAMEDMSRFKALALRNEIRENLKPKPVGFEDDERFFVGE